MHRDSSVMKAPSKYISMMSRVRNNGYQLSEGDRVDLDDTLMYLFQSKIFESPYHSMYLCYPQASTAFLHNVGYGNYGSFVFDNVFIFLTIIGFVIAIQNMNYLFVAN